MNRMNRDTTATDALSFRQMCEIEPGLRELADEIIAISMSRTGSRVCANELFFSPGEDGEPSMKQRMTQLVGWYARDPRLYSGAAYDLAYRTLYNLLPACRCCGCFPLEELA